MTHLHDICLYHASFAYAFLDKFLSFRRKIKATMSDTLPRAELSTRLGS